MALQNAEELARVLEGPARLSAVFARHAYHQGHSPQFGEPRPAVVARDGGRWRLCRRRETLDDLLAGDVAPAAAGGARQEEEA